MKLVNLLVKMFGTDCVDDYMNINEDDDRIIHFAISKDAEQSEPDYFISGYIDNTFVITNINSKELFRTNNESDLKKFIKKSL